MTKDKRSNSPLYVHVSENTPVHLHIEKTKKPSAHAIDQPLKKSQIRSKNPVVNNNNNNKPKLRRNSLTKDNATKSRNIPAAPIRKRGDSQSETEQERKLKPSFHENKPTRERDVDDYLNSRDNINVRISRDNLNSPRKNEHDDDDDDEPTEVTDDNTLDQTEEIRILIRKLLEAEIITETTQQEVNKFFKLVPDLVQQGHFVTAKDVHLLEALQENALGRMSELLLVSTELRGLLRSTYDMLTSISRLREENNHIHTRAIDYEELNHRLQKLLIEKDKQIDELKLQLQKIQDDQRNTTSIHDSLESTKAHLQKQLRQKEADCNRMAVQVRTLESQLVQEKLDCEYMASLLKQRKGQEDESKDALKKAARIMKQKLQKAETTIEQLKEEISEKTLVLNTLQNEIQSERVHSNEVSKTNNNLKDENESLRTRLETAESRVVLQEERNALQQSINDRESNNDWLKDQRIMQLEESNDKKSENAELRHAVEMTESRLCQAEVEMDGMREGLMHYEGVTKELNEQNEARQNDRVSQMMKKLQRTQEELTHAVDQIQETERRLKSSEDQTRDLNQSMQRREETMKSLQLALEEKTKENASLMRQLESSLVDSRRQTETGREKSVVKERQLHARIHELEAELVQLRSDRTRLRHEKEDLERRSQSQVQDLRSQLEHSNVSNRSLQNYIQFLKKSYNNSFGD